jgi:hypothetical protein
MRRKIKQKGSVLLLALLVTTAILGAALSLGIVVIGSIQRASLTTHAFAAYYMAESGLEKALYEIRKENITPNNLAADCGLSGVNCTRQVSYEKDAYYSSLKENKSIQLNLVSTTGGTGAGAESLEIICTDADSSIFPLWLEITLVPIINGSINEDTNSTQKVLHDCSSSENQIIIINTLDSTLSYIVRIKALYDDVSDLTVAAYDGVNGTGNKVDLATKLIVDSRGDFKLSRQKITVEMPPNPVPLSYFDYVLFSEQDLDKEQPTGGGGGGGNGNVNG